MCGFAAVAVVHPADSAVPDHFEAIPEAWLDVFDAAIAHRGPDGDGRFRDRGIRADGSIVDVAIVHRRLSIIDHEGGDQPMVLEAEDVASGLTYRAGEEPMLASDATDEPSVLALAFNGCIYNHRALRRSLASLGERFDTHHSDTEALLRGYHRLGDELRHRLDGMFAAVWWDRRTARLIARRDAAGEKPLYHHRHGPIEAYCSLPISRIDLPWVTRPTPTRRWLTHGFAPSLGDGSEPRNGERQTEPGEWGTSGRVARTPRGGLDGDGEAPPLSAEDVDAMIARSVASRLDADVPIGCFLSGGIDSSLVAFHAQQILSRRGQRLRTFCLRMPGDAFDESPVAAEVAELLGTDHATIDVDPKPAEDLVRLIGQLGLPLGDSSLLPTHWISKAAREHVTVALAGDGGDELFGGYTRYAGNRLLNRHGWWLRLLPECLLPSSEPSGRLTQLRRLVLAARGDRYDDLLAIFPRPIARVLLGPPPSPRREQERDPLTSDFEGYLPDDLLRKVDTASMAVALEVRCPLLSIELISRCLPAPLETLMPRGERKGLLRAVARRHLPHSIVDRPKRGFAIPIGEWFRTDFGGMRTLLQDRLHSTDPFPGLAHEIDRAPIRRMLDEHDAAGTRSINPWKGRDHSQRLYLLLVLSLWCDHRQSLGRQRLCDA